MKRLGAGSEREVAAGVRAAFTQSKEGAPAENTHDGQESEIALRARALLRVKRR